MAWALDVAWATNGASGSGTTITFTYGSAVASGALLVCFVGGEPASIGMTSVADDVNGAWTQVSTGSPVTTGSQDWIWSMWYRVNSGAGTPVITATYGSASSGRAIAAGSYSGIATSSAFDVSAGQGQLDPDSDTGTTTGPVSTGATASTAGANELAVAGMRTQASVGAVTGTGWTQRVNTAVLTNMTIHVQDKNVAASSAVTGVWDLDNVAGDTMAIVGVFKEPAGGGGTAKHLTLLGVG